MAQFDASLQPRVVARKEVFAWAMYDWANSAYSTLAITVLVKYLIFVVDPSKTNFGGFVWAWGIGLTMFCAAIISPVIGAMADAQSNKRTWLAASALGGALATCLMWFATPDRPWLLVALFVVANFLFEVSFGFYNAFLPEIASEQNMGRVSAWGYALGYLGGGLALLAVLMLLEQGHRLGLPRFGEEGADPTAILPRLGLLFTGLWWGAFTLPTLLILKDRYPPRENPPTFLDAARGGLREVATTLRNVRKFRTLALFLLAFLIYNDGVQTVISQASVFADSVLKMPTSELIKVILMIQFMAMPGAWLVGWIADRWGQKFALGLCLAIWTVVLTLAFFVTTAQHFWLMAIVVALVLGGTQSVSRAMMGLMTPARRSAEFFGFFNFSGKATSIFGPLFFGSILYTTGSARLALVSLLLFFAVGWLIVSRVNLSRGIAEAQADNGP